MKEDRQKLLMTVTLVAFIALLMALPASFAIKKANNIDAALDPEIAAGLKAEVPVDRSFKANTAGGEILQPGVQSLFYDNIGSSILIPVKTNVNTFSEGDWTTLGAAPWGLLNTVYTNIDDPQTVLFVFNNKTVTEAFMQREDVKKLLADPKELYAAVNEEETLERFFNYDAVKAALNHPNIINAVASSRIMDAVLRSPSAQYFLKNPRTANGLINKSATLSALKKNAAIAAAVRRNRHTSPVAEELLR